jgi:hypothetical protein
VGPYSTSESLASLVAHAIVAAKEEMLDADTEEMTGGVVSFATVTLTPTAVAVFSAASRATAVRVWAPLRVVVVVQEKT